MILGLRRNRVELAEHDLKWKDVAAETIERLWQIMGSVARDMQHVGSTSINGIKAKPIIDIAVAVDDFAEVEKLTPVLELNGFIKRNWFDDTQLIYSVGENTMAEDRISTHFIHIVKTGSADWYDYVNFRDYLNMHTCVAKEYEAMKICLANENPYDEGREKYRAGKHDFIVSKLNDARKWADRRKGERP